MKRKRLIGVALVVVALASCNREPALSGDARAADAAQIQGIWGAVSYGENGQGAGQEVAPEQSAIRWIIKDTSVIFLASGLADADLDDLTGAFQLDSSKQPKTIDISMGRQTMLGIYEMDGDTLKVCYGRNGVERPTEFKAAAGSNYIMIVFKRLKNLRDGWFTAEDRSPESKVLERWVGMWETEAVFNRAEWTPKENKVTGTVTCKAILGGKFIEEVGRSLGEDTEHRVLFGYDPHKKVYRHWFFDSQGNSSDLDGKWNETTSTMQWKRDLGDGMTSEAETRFIDENTCEWTMVIKGRGGKVYLDAQGRHVRAK